MTQTELVEITVDAPLDDVCHVRASGRLGWGSDVEIKRELARASESDWRNRAVALDLADVSFLDSAGISALLAVNKQLVEGGGSMVLCDVPPRINQAFDIVGMSRLIPIVDNLKSAREMLAS